MLRRSCLLLAALLALPGCRNDDAFIGAWTFDPERSDIVADDLIFTRAPDGKIHSEGGGTAAYDFKVRRWRQHHSERSRRLLGERR